MNCPFYFVQAYEVEWASATQVIVMTTARKNQVDAAVSRWYHCISRSVRRAHLLGEGEHIRDLASSDATAA
ncbi:MAG: hypothetical protein AAF483_05275 [Planctomycetota bacterium]